MKITYNAPFTLTFTLIATAIHAFPQDFTKSFFAVGNTMDFGNPVDYFRLFSHALGHANWNHLFGNLSLILILGPILEEKYGTQMLALMSFITALVTGILNVAFMNTGLYGASGIVFMMILLSSFTNMKAKAIPATFILVLVLFLGKEVMNSFEANNVSQFAHILGGILGSIFGFVMHNKVPTKSNTSV
ncbi:MAG: rhomboid family intramembrane serine protease [Raineya sp.]|nr:rhomboid family intramembrane serine protease [Raineya sp.]MDW8296124.1 rhomboid family intramembrane serine protease [Raineya sp.]